MAQPELSPVCKTTYTHTHIDTELEPCQGPKVSPEFRHDKSPLSLSS